MAFTIVGIMITIKEDISKKKQRRLRAITLKGSIDRGKSNITYIAILKKNNNLSVYL